MRFDDKLLRPDANNFTLVRLILASSVIYTHCYWLATGLLEVDDLSGIMGAPVSSYGVDGFFFLSGFLVYPSLQRLGSPWRFLMARLARLWPGLAASILLTVLAGMLLTTAPGLAYFRGDTLRFIFGNLLFLKGYYGLTGINCGAEFCNINGSLWTLPWEARCYLTLALLGLLGLARPGFMKKVVLPVTLVGALVWDIAPLHRLIEQSVPNSLVWGVDILDRLWTAFAMGVAAYIFRQRLILSWWILAGLLVLDILSQKVGLGLHMRVVFVGYAIMCLAFLTARKKSLSGAWPDYSYGMYIYAFPVMMALGYVWRTQAYLLLGAADFFCTLPFAALSWHFVEKPALDAFRRARRKEVTAPAV